MSPKHMVKLSLLFKKGYYYLILSLIGSIALYPKLPLADVAGTYVAIRLEDLLIGLVVSVWFIFNWRRLRELYSHLIVRAILLFWAMTFLSLISGIFVTQTVSPGLGFLHWLRRVEYMSLFIVGFTTIESLPQIKQFIAIIWITAFLVISYGFGQIWLNFPVISTTNREFSKGQILFLSDNARVNSTFAGHYDLAIFLSMVLIFSSSLFFYYKKWSIKALVAVNSVAGFILLGFTAARISFVAAILGIAGVFWLKKQRVFLVGLAVLAIGLLVAVPDLRHRLVATLTVNVLNGGGAKYSPSPGVITAFTPQKYIPVDKRQEIEERLKKEATFASSSNTGVPADAVAGEPINSTELGVYRSWGIRLDVEWPRAIGAFYKNPFLGTGYSSISIATDNDILRALGETGLLGVLSLVLIFVILVKRFYYHVYHSKGLRQYLGIVSICLIGELWVTGTFIDVLEASKIAEIFWLMLGVFWSGMKYA